MKALTLLIRRLTATVALFSATASLALADIPVAPTTESTPSAATQIDQLLSAAFHPDAPGAAVLVVRDGKILLRKGYGLADLELGVPMDAAQVLPICSLTKQFTAVAILQLAQAGSLKLDDPLSTYVPDYPTGSAPVTLEQLLTHTAGLPTIEEQPEAKKNWHAELTPNQLLDYTRSQPLLFAPGSNWKYSNTGYYLLGRVIEQVSGQSYPEYVRTHLFAPAGMTHSDYPDANRIIRGRARGYSRSGKTWIDTPYFNITQGYSAGALLASVDDLWSWEQALASGRLVEATLLSRAYTEGHLPDGRATHYGFGWEINQLGSHSVIAHGGGMPGFASFAARVPGSGLYVAILCNTDAPPQPLRTLTTRVIHLALGEPADTPVPAAAVTPAALSELAGTYRIAPGANFIATAKDNILTGQLGPGRRPLIPIAEDTFAAGSDMQFHFLRDASHHVTQIAVATDGPGPEQIWPRVEDSTLSPK